MLCKIVEIKIGGKTWFENLLKQLFHFALVGYEVIITNSRYAIVGYFITSYPTRAHGIIVIYFQRENFFFCILVSNAGRTHRLQLQGSTMEDSERMVLFSSAIQFLS